jgi:hypothetical protein
MATKKKTKAEQQEELIQTLKFTPRTYKIYMWGYGGERVLGTVDREIYDYFKDNKLSVSDFAWDSDYADVKEIPEDMWPFPPGSWYECDSLTHISGVALDGGSIQVDDENGDSIYEKELSVVVDDDVQTECVAETYISSQEGVVFSGISSEKGTFFEAELDLTAPFDPAKLTIHFEDVDGEELVYGVSYDGQELDNYGGDTTGKSSDFNFYVVEDSEIIETYSEPVNDWVNYWPEDYEKTAEFKFNKKNQPKTPGWYHCYASTDRYSSTSGLFEWDGDKWLEYEYDVPKEVLGVKTWYGLNWDTTDMKNRPKRKPRTPKTDVYPYPTQEVLKAAEEA